MADIPGLGQGTPDLKVVREEHPLPGKRKDLLAAFESIIKRGGVKKFVIELGQPIRVERYVRYDEVGPELEITNDDIYFAVRNAHIVPVSFDKETAVDGMQTMFHLFQRVWDQKMVPKTLLVNNVDVFFEWLGIGRPTLKNNAFGVDLVSHKEVPDDVLLFVCAKPEEPDVVTTTLQTNMEP